MKNEHAPLLTSADFIPKGATIALYGSGEFGKQIYEWCRDQRPDLSVAMFLDSNTNGMAYGLPQVKAADYAQGDIKSRVDFILICSHFTGEISVHLKELGINNAYVFDRSIMGLLQFTD